MCERSEDSVLRPKALRACSSNVDLDTGKPLRRHRSSLSSDLERDAGVEILGIFLSKDCLLDAESLSCSPPYFEGSPPRRTGNPLIHDVQFQQDRYAVPVKGRPVTVASFRGNPIIRVEGFECSGHGFESKAQDVGRQVSAYA